MQNAEKVCEFNQDLFWLNLQSGDKSGEGIFLSTNEANNHSSPEQV